ncbi:MAG: sigma-54-dependent Fis family transcriptional regulator [Planctomycetes bacterium]|nr:sigma-54-dependent Fis family transcriptional regulator [Planctomycetota bacterium]
MKLNVLVVEDNEVAGESLLELLEEFDYKGVLKATAEEGLETIQKSDIDIVLADLALPGQDGMWLLEQVHENDNGIPVIMITGNASVDTAVQAIKNGAYDYLSKPIDINRLSTILTGASRMRQISLQNEILSGEQGSDSFSQMIGESEAITKLKTVIGRVGPTQASVLILGESGTGKELVANSLVACSKRSKSPYVKLNSAALPKDTLESELFGHVKGSFTGAIKDRKGRFELAHGGTLFLDEIGDMPMETQVKLLRVLQEGEFERVGGSEVIKVDVRIIAATNRNLLQAVEEGRFREDLYYRLNVIDVKVPPLRTRGKDIILLAKSMLEDFCGSEKKTLSEDVKSLLLAYRWPGNIRELKNVMERLSIIVTEELILPSDLPLEITSSSSSSSSSGAANAGLSEGATMDEIERNAILSTLQKTKGVKSEAAKALGIGLKTLYRKLEKYAEEGVDLSFLKS